MLGQDIKLKTVIVDMTNSAMLSSFSCGNEVIDEYIAHKSAKDYTAVTKMILNADNDDIICVYSLCCSSFIINSCSKYHPNPAVEIKIFALSKDYQDMKYSDNPEDGCLSNYLLNGIIWDIVEFTDNICGANIVLLYSTDEGYDFYIKNGFNDFIDSAMVSGDKFIDGCRPMFMALR